MDVAAKYSSYSFQDQPSGRSPAYDPGNLHPADAEARQYDDDSDGIDWDEVIATTQDDWIARRFAFDSTNYPTHEAAMAAMWEWMRSILQEVEREIAAERSCDAASR